MQRITIYVLAELLRVFLMTLLGMTVFIILVGLAQEAVRQGLGPAPILKLVPYVLPNALRFAVPGTMLFATCSVFGRMSAANEVVAIKSLGVSATAVVRPVLVLAFIVSLIAVWLNDIAVSWGRRGVQRVVIQSVEQIAYGMLRTQRAYNTRRFSIHVKRVEGRKLILPTLSFHAGDETPPVMVTAQEAEMRFNPEKNVLSIYLTNGEIDVGDKIRGRFPDTIEREIPLPSASGNSASLGPSDCPLREIPREMDRQRATIRHLEQSLAAQAAYQLATGDFSQLTDAAWRSRHDKLQQARRRLFRLQTEPWRRWANGFSCFFFVLVGAPLAIRLRNSDLWTSFAVCFLPVLLLYYPLLAYGVDRAKCGALPPYAVWLGNAILLVVGIWLLRRVNRY